MAGRRYGAAMSDSIRLGTPPLAPAPARPQRTRLIVAVILAAAVLFGGAMIGYVLLRKDSIAVTGHLDLTKDGFTMRGSHCTGDGGYSDIAAGAQVVVTDAAGATVAVGRLGEGSWVGAHCEFPFAVDVPSGSEFYGIEVSHRGVVQYPRRRLADPIVLTLG